MHCGALMLLVARAYVRGKGAVSEVVGVSLQAFFGGGFNGQRNLELPLAVRARPTHEVGPFDESDVPWFPSHRPMVAMAAVRRCIG